MGSKSKFWLRIWGLLISFLLLLLIPRFQEESFYIYANVCYLCDCCDDQGCQTNCAVEPDIVENEDECDDVCSGKNKHYCNALETACPGDDDGGDGGGGDDGGGGGGGGGNSDPCGPDCNGHITHKACNLTLDQVTSTTATVAWQPADPITTRVILHVCRGTRPSRYVQRSSCVYYEQDVTGRSSFTATGLTPDTDYWAMIATVGGADVCQDEKFWDGSVVFHTRPLNQPPTCDLSALPSSLTEKERLEVSGQPPANG